MSEYRLLGWKHTSAATIPYGTANILWFGRRSRRWSWLSELLRETARAHEMVVHAGSIIAATTPRMAQSRIERSFILRTRQGLLANSLCSRLPPLDVAKRQSDFSDDQGND
jgi:hypothetical protein